MSEPPARPASGKLLVRVLGVLGAATLVTWLVVGFAACRHAGLF